MVDKLIDCGLTAANVLSLSNNVKQPKTDKERKEMYETNKNISLFRNTAYLLRRIIK